MQLFATVRERGPGFSKRLERHRNLIADDRLKVSVIQKLTRSDVRLNKTRREFKQFFGVHPFPSDSVVRAPSVGERATCVSGRAAGLPAFSSPKLAGPSRRRTPGRSFGAAINAAAVERRNSGQDFNQ